MPGITSLIDLSDRYFSSTSWMIVFLVSVSYLFFRVGIAYKRAFLAVVGAFFLVVNEVVIRWFINLGEDGAFYRHLWAIPTMMIIGIAVIDLIRILPKWFLRIQVIIALAILLWFIDQHEYIRCRDQTFSADAQIVPKDVIELSEGLEELRKEAGKETIFIVCPAAYERNYGNMCTELNLYSGFLSILDSSILNNEEHNGETELTGEMPDIDYIMSTCCAKGVDYVIIRSQERAITAFREIGYYPVVRCEGYIVYKCEGYEGYKQDINRMGLTSWLQYVDEKGNPVLNELGYSKIVFEYDNLGNKSKESYYDETNNPTNRTDLEVASIEYRYESRTIIGIRYYGKDGLLTLMKGEFAGSDRIIDKKGRIIKEFFLDTEEKPVIFSSGYAGYAHVYNENGYLIEESYLDTEGKLVNLKAGFAKICKQYNAQNQVSYEWYEDAAGNICVLSGGYSGIKREYNESGDITDIIYTNSDGQESQTASGFSRIHREYDSDNRLIREMFLDINGIVINTSLGNAGTEKIYDVDGNLVKE